MMNVKRWIAFGLALCISFTLTACGNSGTKVFVQSVSSLMNMGGIAPGDHFLGLVVSEHVTKIEKDSDKAVKELFVQEGIDVKHIGPKGQNYRPEGLGQSTTGDFDSRSKGEAIIAELLMARKIVFQFERELRIKLANGQVIVLHPDFCIPTRDGGYILWEHLGRLDAQGYAIDAGERLHLYNQAGYNPGSNLILTANDRSGYMDMKTIAQILDWLETVCVFEG